MKNIIKDVKRTKDSLSQGNVYRDIYYTIIYIYIYRSLEMCGLTSDNK